MTVKQLKGRQPKDTNIKILRDEYNIDRMTGEQAIAFRPKNLFKLKFEQVDEPILKPSSEDQLESEEPAGDLLDQLVDKFPAPKSWYKED